MQTSDDLVKYIHQIPLQWFKKQTYYDTSSAQVLKDGAIYWLYLFFSDVF
jgi:hypothetical protein